MIGRSHIVTRVSVAIVIAVSLGVAWSAVLMWGGLFVSQFFDGPIVYESITVPLDGTPVIQSQTLRNSMWVDTTHRTLDGEKIEVDLRQEFPGTEFGPPIQLPGVYETSISWPERIAGASDFQRPPVEWFAVRDDEVLGRMHFVGFDHESKMLVGYIGRNGFSRVVPPHDQWFEIGRATLSWRNPALASSSQISPAARLYDRYQTFGTSQLPSWVVFVIDGDRLQEVDLRGRNVRKVLDLPGIQQAAITYELPTHTTKDDAAAGKQASQGQTTTQQQVDWKLNVAARNADRIVELNSRKERREFKLSKSLQDSRFTAYFLPSGEMLAVWTEKDRPPGETEVGWMRPDGTFSKQRAVQLAVQPQQSNHTGAWLAAGVAPVTAGWLGVISVVAPLEMMQMHQAASYASGVAKLFPFTTLPLLAVIALSAFLAWQTAKLQRKYHRSATRVWATFVFLLGLPGFLAYLVEQRRPKMEACPQCNDIVPRDRSACASCNAEFLAPPRLGTEIFA